MPDRARRASPRRPAAPLRRASRPRGCGAHWRTRWSTVCGEMPSLSAISLDDRCWSTSARHCRWPVAQPRHPILGRIRQEQVPTLHRKSSHRDVPHDQKGTRQTRTSECIVATSSRTKAASRNGLIRHGRSISEGNCAAASAGAAVARRKRGGQGWIRTSVRETRADLQSAAFNHSATCPGGKARPMAGRRDAVNRAEAVLSALRGRSAPRRRAGRRIS